MTESTYKIDSIKSSIKDDDGPVRFDLLIHQPKQLGTHPLLVFNHGSCGYEIDSEKLGTHHPYQPIADYFLKRDWIVAIPHRRGRGNSDRVYDEGLNENRDGYSLDTDIALKGARRAYVDLEACIDVLMKRPDVDTTKLVLGGHSRGGILSIAYAGNNSDQVKGVVNFVGGWIGECENARIVNGELARQGSPYTGKTLWLYSGKDQFYSAAHSRWLFQEYIRSGGCGEYAYFPDADHDLLWSNSLWRKAMNTYMDNQGFPEFAEK